MAHVCIREEGPASCAQRVCTAAGATTTGHPFASARMPRAATGLLPYHGVANGVGEYYEGSATASKQMAALLPSGWAARAATASYRSAMSSSRMGRSSSSFLSATTAS